MTSSAPEPEPRALDVEIDAGELQVRLVNGRRIFVPLSWFPRLLHAPEEARRRWELLGDGEGIHWPDVDEDISVAGLLRGAAAPGVAR